MKKMLMAGSATLLLLANAPLASADSTSQVLWLDTYAPTGLPSVTSGPLAGTYYFATVSGAVSIWSRTTLDCGQPKAMTYPSASRPTRDAGVDAEFRFAQPSTPSAPCGAVILPRHSSMLQVDTGTGFQHVEPVGGQPAAPAADNSYRYLLKGTQRPATFAARFEDVPSSDNAGQFRIEVRPAGKADCQGSRWQEFGAFRNRGDCVSFFSTGERNQPQG